MNSKILILSAIVSAVVFSSCKKLFEDEELSMERVDYTGTELRTDGYYYYMLQVEHNGIQEKRVFPIFLYRNGVSLSAASSFDCSEIEQKENEFINGKLYHTINGYKILWSVFTISGKSIEFEGWDDLGGAHLYTKKVYGKILNDTTFHIYQEHIDGIDKECDRTYHFKQFSPKPDSTNRFIK
ncbi:MAG: hypothetical protein J6U04_12925 [Salinivirgaceae bacterium]|nr:hypothetical protein [Salinivirgaceae bacterium]